MGKSGVEFKAVMSTDQLKTYLKDLLASLDEGAICVQCGSEYVALTPKEMVKVEVEAKEKKDKSKFSLELTWRNEMEIKGDASALKITSVIEEPAPEAPEEAAPGEEAQPQAGGDSGDDEAEEHRHGD